MFNLEVGLLSVVSCSDVDPSPLGTGWPWSWEHNWGDWGCPGWDQGHNQITTGLIPMMMLLRMMITTSLFGHQERFNANSCTRFANAFSWKKILVSWFKLGGGWGCEVSCGGHHRPRGKTTAGSALDGAVFDIAQMLAYLVHNMSRSQLYLGFGHFGWLPSFLGQ